MLNFVSEVAENVGFRLIPVDFLGTCLLLSSEVWNSTCWNLDGFAGAGDFGTIVFSKVDVGRVYLSPVNIGSGVDMGVCLSYTCIFTGFSSSVVWAGHEIMWIGVSDVYTICTLWSVLIIWIIFSVLRYHSIVQVNLWHTCYILMYRWNMVLVYSFFTYLYHLNWLPIPGRGYWSPCPRYISFDYYLNMFPWGVSSYSKVLSSVGT